VLLFILRIFHQAERTSKSLQTRKPSNTTTPHQRRTSTDIHNMVPTIPRGTMAEFFHLLHDDALISIGEYVGKLYGPEAYTQLALTCRKMRQLLLSNETNSMETIRNIIQLRVEKVTSSRHDFSIRTLEELAIFEQWCTTPLHQNNGHHIPFPLASLEVDESMHEKIFAIINIMERFPSITVQIDSHCGIIAPNSVAASFSRSRGEALYVMFFGVIHHHVFKL